MIEEIRIEDLGVIGSATVPLGSGLTVITGETGAGKTMVLSALNLLLGGRADPSTVRVGSSRAVVEGVFVAGEDASRRAQEAGAELEPDGALLVARSVAAPGRSRAHLGGRSVPQAVLAQVTEDMVTVHGQSDQVRLRSPRRQRSALDAFAGPSHTAVVEQYRTCWGRRQRLRDELEELLATARDRAREAELLRLGLAEVERVAPQPGEDEDLAAEAARLGHAEDLRSAALIAQMALSGSEDAVAADGAVPAVEHARRALDQVAEHDEALGQLSSRLAELAYLLGDVGVELAGYADGIQSDPARLEAVHQRRAELSTLARAHGGTVAEVLSWAEDAGRRMLELDRGTDRVDEVRAALEAADHELSKLAGTISGTRADAARRLAEAVTDELAGLAMASARLEVSLEALPEPGPWGAEDVTMHLSAHDGGPARPLGQGASGGELSRVMLAIEVALATAPSSGATRPPTFVFDEVDAGVGGRAAVEVGRRLAELAHQAQVIVVTHLAQVAAYADHHVVVTKSHGDDGDVVTESDVTVVDGPERVAELARMLSGSQESASALEHAAELLERSVVGR